MQTVTPIEPLLQRVVHHFYSSSWIIHPLAKLIIDGEAKQVKIVYVDWRRIAIIMVNDVSGDF